MTRKQGAIAQLVEQRTENPCVPGSIPGGTTHMVGWMSGLVSGLQNQPQRFESATDLTRLIFGRLAQLVQSVCLTSRGSAVRIRQRPQVDADNYFNNPTATTKLINILLQ